MISVVLLSLMIFLLCFVLKKQRDKPVTCKPGDKPVTCKPGDSSLPLAPGPKPYPFLGSLHLLANRKIPFEAFTSLREEYGSVVSLKLGTTNCVVLQGEQSIHQALVTKAEDFDSRPNFLRFHLMFGGSKKNALAFCDYDELQKMRKKILALYTFPRYLSYGWRKLDQTFSAEMPEFMNGLNPGSVDLKPLLSKACSNIFNNYFCDTTRRAYNDIEFNNYIDKFDQIFWEVNNGRMVDFIPELMPLMGRTMKEVTSWCEEIRDYTMDNIVHGQERAEGKDNLLECLLERVKKDDLKQDCDTKLTLDAALYALEDILGGHCAVSNITLRMLRYIAQNPEIQEQLITELDTELQSSDVVLEDVTNIQFLTACFYETLRLTSSAIVPHMTNKDTSVGGFFVAENTVVFINNHYSNFSEEYWTEPDRFNPNRFMDSTGKMKKPQSFLPFSTGRRSCIGSKMVQLVSTSLTATILRKYRLNCDIAEVPLGMLALPPTPAHFMLIERPPAHYSDQVVQPLLLPSPSHPALSMLISHSDDVHNTLNSTDSSDSEPTFFICSSTAPTKISPCQESSPQKIRHNSSEDSLDMFPGLGRTNSAFSLPKLAARLRHASSK